jgi:hypothetical protein
MYVMRYLIFGFHSERPSEKTVNGFYIANIALSEENYQNYGK